ncbi:Phosphate-selective porin O and P [Desulfocicer vacuolatum DSM 3385]|uniref:Phosphate-selective porin O and P n=1 Tax=Desulfocicer vacuolatum DSM 3385 TaxID=1121400 RepID=A0A1W1YSY2_9BACT|nr:LbtU family siderophore porin [Desulfocicer vacuolatum]SMC39212.1 Phosphate-selective porin O and P [Desulfocicer vacuolatum DSM 3385]
MKVKKMNVLTVKWFQALFCGLMLFCITSMGWAEELSNFALGERITQLEEKMKGGGGALPGWLDRISMSGVIEVEAGFESLDFDNPAAEDEDSSDFSLATVELGIEGEISEHVSGSLLLLYEDGEDIVFDEAFITLTGGENLPFYLKAGELYVPFGSFESNMISDPLTLEIGETRETALEVGYEIAGFYCAAYLFNGDVDEVDGDNDVDNFGLNAGYALETDAMSLDMGISYINNLLDSDGMGDIVDGSGAALDEYVGGVALHGVFNFGPLTVIGEYVGATDEPEWNYANGTTGEGEKPCAWNAEVGYTFEMAGKETVVGLAYQGTDNLEDELPETRVVGAVAVAILENTTLALEYLHDEFESDDEADVITAQLAIEF